MNMDRVKIERNRISYKSRADLWRRLFLGAMALLTVTGWLLGMAVRANVDMAKELSEMEAFCNKDVTREVK